MLFAPHVSKQKRKHRLVTIRPLRTSQLSPVDIFANMPEQAPQLMNVGNMPTTIMNNPSSFEQSGMGDIWSDLMTAGNNYMQADTAKSIAQSQASQAAAQAQIAASQARASGFKMPSTPVMLALAGGLAALLMVMRRRRA